MVNHRKWLLLFIFLNKNSHKVWWIAMRSLNSMFEQMSIKEDQKLKNVQCSRRCLYEMENNMIWACWPGYHIHTWISADTVQYYVSYGQIRLLNPLCVDLEVMSVLPYEKDLGVRHDHPHLMWFASMLVSMQCVYTSKSIWLTCDDIYGMSSWVRNHAAFYVDYHAAIVKVTFMFSINFTNIWEHFQSIQWSSKHAYMCMYV